MLKTGVQERQAISVRRSGRIAIRIPVEVSGLDRHGADFEETAFTTTVSRHGAAVSILRSLKPEQEIRIRRAKGNIDSVFRVVGQIGLHNLDNVYGVARENAGTDVWGITHLRGLQRKMNVWSALERRFRDDATLITVERTPDV